MHDECMEVVQHLKSLRLPVQHRAEPLERIERNWRLNYPRKEFQLFTFYGLGDHPESAAANSSKEHVYYLWADAGVGSWIRARMVSDDVRSHAKGGPVWHVEFDNKPEGSAVNLAIRPTKRSVVSAVPRRFKRLRFYARIPSNFAELVPCAESKVYIGIRLVDALTTHWVYCSVRHEYLLMQVACGERWQEFEIPMHDSTRWSVFPADGNCCYHDKQPDFSQILAVVVEMGSNGAKGPGPGAGVVQMKGFHFE